MPPQTATELAAHVGPVTPGWTVAPFVCYLLLIATLPLFFGRLWESNRNKLILALAAGAPVVVYLLGIRAGGLGMLLETGLDYLSFMALLGSLFAISGGICLRGSLAGTPLVNTALMAVGALLASVIGTTGAAALLIRPLLRANERRRRVSHLVVFFIFIVANGGGLLTPLGDPPLFLGFLRGVPFTWTMRLLPIWALENGVLLVLFGLFDVGAAWLDAREPRRRTTTAEKLRPIPLSEPLRLDGTINLLWLLGIVAVVFAMGTYGPRISASPAVRSTLQMLGMLVFAVLSWRTTPQAVREANRFSWAPMVEVAAIFVGVFLTMIPALTFLEERGASLGVTKPWQFFWASGALSSVLDNAPTYLTFASLAVGVADGGAGVLSASKLDLLAAHPTGQALLTAISAGAVMMGAVTYIGNGPNFMVKAIAEQHHVRTPSFFGYVVWSVAILIPLFGVISHLFF
jgi:Na+/H+ antiporter NhaD/arsenite permease-like protein